MLKEEDSIIYSLYKAFYLEYWNLNGRARRREFWSVILLQVLVAVMFTALHFLYFQFENNFLIQLTFYVIAYAYAAMTVVPTISVHIRRLHDAGKSGWWHPLGIGFLSNITFGSVGLIVVFIYGLVALLIFNGIPPIESEMLELFVNSISIIISIVLACSIIAGLVFLFFDSEHGSNQWGENPKGENGGNFIIEK